MRTELQRGWWCGVICLWWGLLASEEVLAADLVIVQDGQPKATIVIAQDAPESIRQKLQTAAEELQTYLQKMSGATLTIVDDSQNPPGALILVGRSRLTDPSGHRHPDRPHAGPARRGLRDRLSG